MTGDFFPIYEPNIEHLYVKSIEVVPGKNVFLALEVVTGQEHFGSMQHEWIRMSEISVLCFGINEKDGLDKCVKDFERGLRAWVDTDDHFSSNCMVLVGCKMDLYYGDGEDAALMSDKDKEIMDVNYKRAMELSMLWNVPFIETSAKEYINVYTCFRQMVIEYWLQTQTNSVNRRIP